MISYPKNSRWQRWRYNQLDSRGVTSGDTNVSGTEYSLGRAARHYPHSEPLVHSRHLLIVDECNTPILKTQVVTKKQTAAVHLRLDFHLLIPILS